MRRTAGVGATLLGLVVVAVVWLVLSSRLEQPRGPASAPPMEPSLSAVDVWGPLAVIPPQDGASTGRAEGTLRITANCVLLDERGETSLLIWPADRATWHAEAQAIGFRNFDGSIVTVGDGNHVVLGGGGGSAAESGISGEEWVRRTVWVVPPLESCPLDAWWGVGAVGE